MPPRPSFLEQVSENTPKTKARPMLIPRRVSTVHAEGPTSVTEETISSSHSSESLMNGEDSPASRQTVGIAGGGGVAVGPHGARLADSPAAGVASARSDSVASRMRPMLQRMGSSYSRGSFVGKNGSFISTSLSDDGGSGGGSNTGETPGLFEAVCDSSDLERDHDHDYDHEHDHDHEHNDEHNHARAQSRGHGHCHDHDHTHGQTTPEDRETTLPSSVPRGSAPIDISTAPMAKTLSSKYFQESVHDDGYLQNFTPFHNTPTSVSNSYSTNATGSDLMARRLAHPPAADPEPRLSDDPALVYIAEFPTDKLLSMLTALLDKIVRSNDQLSRDRPFDEDQFLARAADATATASASADAPAAGCAGHDLAAEILSFRGKHVPAITLHQYFQRIQKYCPTTNDVFLSLLVYFDRIAKTCNHAKEQLFVMDSYNIHRLIISAVTVSTKFFSDFFYSNSRYARVGGISLKELNHLELQFLVLCDFELIISVEELQKYSNLLRDFWHREMGDAPEAETAAPEHVL
ncbi:Cyclin [Lachancea thermotolerans]